LSNIHIDPATTTLDPEVVAQLEQLWQIKPYIPLAGAVERVSLFIMHITVTILILQVFKQKKPIWLAFLDLNPPGSWKYLSSLQVESF